MCRIEERIYISADGRRSIHEKPFFCERSRGGAMCSGPTRRTTEYHHKRTTSSRDGTPSPINPATPTGTGSYLVQQRRPSGTGSRPSTRDGHKEIVIEFGSKNSRGKKYPSVSVSTKDYSRSSLGSFGSNDAAIESPGSDASYPIRTGFPEAPFPPIDSFGQPRGSLATPAHGYHHRHSSSASSFTNSSRTPSLYVTSEDYDEPVNQRTPRNPPTVVHNHPAPGPPSPSRRQSGLSPASYRTSIITPHGISQETHTLDGLYPRDSADSADVSASSYTSSGAPGNTRRSKESDERRRKKDEDRRRQEESDIQNAKQVRFELDRPKARAQERADKLFAEKAKDRAAAREETHRRREEERVERERQERAEKSAAERKREKSKPPTTDFNAKRPGSSRRMSATMTPAQLAEQRRLLAAEELRMQSEREATEAREREEAATYEQQQEPLAYYDPRGGDRSLSSKNNSTMHRRTSISRHDSVSGVRSPGLTGTGSKRRTSISQPNPPSFVDTQVPTESYTTRSPSSRTRAPPPLSFPANFKQDLGRPSSSSRRASFNQDNNPFAAPPTRGLGPKLDNPFSPTMSPSTDPWDTRAMQDALPIGREREGQYNTMQQRGEAVINQSRSHHNARQATRAMGKAAEYTSAFETDSDSLEDSTPIVYASRTGLSGKGKKKY